jgi:hypothetical protein
MNRDYVNRKITEIVNQLDEIRINVYDFSVALEVYDYDEVCIDLDLHKIKATLKRMSADLWNDQEVVLVRHFPAEPDPDRLREDAEDCARPVNGPEA